MHFVFIVLFLLIAGPTATQSFSKSLILRYHRPVATTSVSCVSTTAEDASAKGDIYVLHLAHDRFYVGKTQRTAHQRVREHFRSVSSGARWTQHYRPLQRLLPLTSMPGDLESWERAETLERMFIYGVHRVRGWRYTKEYLSKDEINSIIGELCERKDLCRVCGTAHNDFSAKCKRSPAPWMKLIRSDDYIHPDYEGKVFEKSIVRQQARDGYLAYDRKSRKKLERLLNQSSIAIADAVTSHSAVTTTLSVNSTSSTSSIASDDSSMFLPVQSERNNEKNNISNNKMKKKRKSNDLKKRAHSESSSTLAEAMGEEDQLFLEELLSESSIEPQQSLRRRGVESSIDKAKYQLQSNNKMKRVSQQHQMEKKKKKKDKRRKKKRTSVSDRDVIDTVKSDNILDKKHYLNKFIVAVVGNALWVSFLTLLFNIHIHRGQIGFRYSAVTYPSSIWHPAFTGLFRGVSINILDKLRSLLPSQDDIAFYFRPKHKIYFASIAAIITCIMPLQMNLMRFLSMSLSRWSLQSFIDKEFEDSNLITGDDDSSDSATGQITIREVMNERNGILTNAAHVACIITHHVLRTSFKAVV